ncbi:MAG: dimethyl sulfoxide reductase anchor subunit [Nitrospinota bacterium]|nr:dimethyl sulfoxide reductase anchor subunit [Nitrospinota bacterium]
MRPEYSLIILTVLAGAGQGLFFFLVTGDMAGFAKGSRVPPNVVVMGIAWALALTLLGMAASFFHLAHKARGIKAINKWRYSWLSREVVLLPVFVALLALYGFMRGSHMIPVLIEMGPKPQEDGSVMLYSSMYYSFNPLVIQAVGIAGIAVAFALFISTAMIYGHLKIIREWGTAFTPMNFTLTGLICGGALIMTVYQAGFSPFGAALFNMRLFFAIAFVGLVVKLLYYYRNSRPYSPTTIQTALGINHPKIRLMETGSAYPTYNTMEYHYTGLEGSRSLMKTASIFLLYIIPMAALAWDYMALISGGKACMGWVAAACAMTGAFMERWLFFVEGNHAQNHYYGNFPAPTAINPILQPGKKDAPLPPA